MTITASEPVHRTFEEFDDPGWITVRRYKDLVIVYRTWLIEDTDDEIVNVRKELIDEGMLLLDSWSIESDGYFVGEEMLIEVWR